MLISFRVDSKDIYIDREMPVDAFVGYLSTWSGWRTCLKENPECQRLEEVRQRYFKSNTCMMLSWSWI